MKAEKYKNSVVQIIKQLFGIEKSIFFIIALFTMLSAVIPYIYYFGFAELINKQNTMTQSYFFYLIACIVLLNFFLSSISRFLLRYLEVKRNSIDEKVKLKLRNKTMNIDYSLLVTKEMSGMIRTAETSFTYTGGFNTFLIHFQTLLQNNINFILALFIFIRLLFTGKNAGAILNIKVSSVFFNSAVLIIFLIGLYIFFFVTKKISQQSNTVFDTVMQDEKKLSYFLFKVFNDYQKAMSIRLSGMADMIDKEYRKLNMSSFKKNKKLLFFNRLLAGNGMLFTFIFTALGYMLVSAKVFYKEISIGSLLIYAAVIANITASITAFFQTTQVIKQQADRLVKYVNIIDISCREKNGKLKPDVNIKEAVFEFENVSFAYNKNSANVFTHLNCKFVLNKNIAFIGENGSGKTTFVYLLLGLYEPNEGIIKMNGIDIREYDYDIYLDLFSVVFQDFSLFAFPLGENIAGTKTFDAEKIEVLAKKIHAEQHIKKLPCGVHSELFSFDSTGVNISGGEAQKFAILRALYKESPFIIMDEPTASLDPISEYEIYANLKTICGDKPVIFISHRMGCCKFSDKVFLFNGGNIIQGTHEALLFGNEYYRELWNIQADMYKKNC